MPMMRYKPEQMKRLKELEKENSKLKRLVAELSTDKKVWEKPRKVLIITFPTYKRPKPAQ